MLKEQRDKLREMLASVPTGEWTLGDKSLTSYNGTGSYRTPVLANKAPDGEMMPAQTFATTRDASLRLGELVAASHNSLTALLDYLDACEEEADAAREHESECHPAEPHSLDNITGHKLRNARAKRDRALGRS